MVSLICKRSTVQLIRRSLHMTCNRLYASDQDGSKYLPDPLDLATGVEKIELMSLLAGNDDPFDMKPAKRGVGTKECPNLVGSYVNKRLIACLCEPDDMHFEYMWLHKGPPQRCYCGYYFLLVEREAFPSCD